MVLATTSAVSIALSAAFFYYHKVSLRNLERKWNEKRLAERRGRIRAEVSLRTHLKEVEQSKLNNEVDEKTNCNAASSNASNDNKMLLKCIGTVITPFTKRMGTPRQGALVPSSRAYLQLEATINVEILDGMEDYSHCWVLFQFHANTNGMTTTNGGFATNKKTKIRPPRTSGHGNQKVGILATRSPHRPNPMGLSLVKVDRVEKKLKRLYLNGIDLVHGTPVYGK